MNRFSLKPSSLESETTNFTIHIRFKLTKGMPSIRINVWWFWILLLVDIGITWCGFGKTCMLTIGCEVLFTLKKCNNLNVID
jgi:hypothetical protein